jgi:hypothetical protein
MKIHINAVRTKWQYKMLKIQSYSIEIIEKIVSWYTTVRNRMKYEQRGTGGLDDLNRDRTTNTEWKQDGPHKPEPWSSRWYNNDNDNGSSLNKIFLEGKPHTPYRSDFYQKTASTDLLLEKLWSHQHSEWCTKAAVSSLPPLKFAQPLRHNYWR